MGVGESQGGYEVQPARPRTCYGHRVGTLLGLGFGPLGGGGGEGVGDVEALAEGLWVGWGGVGWVVGNRVRERGGGGSGGGEERERVRVRGREWGEKEGECIEQTRHH